MIVSCCECQELIIRKIKLVHKKKKKIQCESIEVPGGVPLCSDGGTPPGTSINNSSIKMHMPLHIVVPQKHTFHLLHNSVFAN